MAEREQQFIPVDPAPIQNLTQFLPESGIFSKRNVEQAAVDLADLVDFIPGGSAYREAVDPFYTASDLEKTLDAGFFKNIPKYLLVPYMQAVKKRDILKQTVKREGDNIRIDGRPAEVAQAKARKSLAKTEREIGGYEKQFKEEFGLDLSLPRAPMINTKTQGILDLIKDPKNIYHGSPTKGIGSFTLPEDYGSKGGLYLLDQFTDPRLKLYAKGRLSQGDPGSAYIAEPDFKNMLTVGDTSKQMDKFLKNLEINLSKQKEFSEPAYQVRQLRNNIVGVPTSFTKEASEGLRDIGIDAIKIPNKRGSVRTGDLNLSKPPSDTFISLNPSENLNILDEVPYEDIEGLIKELMKK